MGFHTRGQKVPSRLLTTSVWSRSDTIMTLNLSPLPLRVILPRHYGHRRKRFAG